MPGSLWILSTVDFRDFSTICISIKQPQSVIRVAKKYTITSYKLSEASTESLVNAELGKDSVDLNCPPLLLDTSSQHLLKQQLGFKTF